MKRVFISGQKHFGAQVFHLCCHLGLEIAGVSSPPFGSDGKRVDRLREAALKAGAPWMAAGTLTQHTLPNNIDLIVCAHSHDFIGAATRFKARLGAIGYVAATGATPTGISSSDQFSVDNLDVEGILSSAAITEQDIGAGKYDYAAIECFAVNTSDLTQGIMVYRVGWLGEVTLKNGQFTAELRGLAQKLQTNIGEIFSPSCRATFGDARCKVNLASYTFSGTVTSVTSQQAFIASGMTQASGYFTGGEVQWLTGANAGLNMEVKAFLNGQFTFVLPMPNAITAGDTFHAIAGCDKTFPTCCNTFNNAVNFRGEPYVPGMDQLLTTASTTSTMMEG